MKLFPAIDLQNGRCVRLEQGNYERSTVYSEDPVEVAQNLEAQGAEVLHVVDLDGAREERLVQLDVVRAIVGAVRIPVQAGGGFRSADDLEQGFRAGLWRIVLGSLMLEDPKSAARLARKYPAQLVAAVDVFGLRVRSKGWLDESSTDPQVLISGIKEWGIDAFLCTEISKDGMLDGPAFQWYEKLRRNNPSVELMAAGGVSSAEDIVKLAEIGVDGVIVGKALSEGNLTMEDALRAAMTEELPGS